MIIINMINNFYNYQKFVFDLYIYNLLNIYFKKLITKSKIYSTKKIFVKITKILFFLLHYITTIRVCIWSSIIFLMIR